MSEIHHTAKKLAPLIRLLASDQAGEVSAAVAGIRRVLGANGLDINDLAAWIERMGSVAAAASASAKKPDPAPGKAKPSTGGEDLGLKERARRDKDWPRYWRAVVDELRSAADGRLSLTDSEFLENIRAATNRGRSPSAAQRQWIHDIEAKLGLREARAS